MLRYFFFFFFNDTATTEIYTLSLHDALPIFYQQRAQSNDFWLMAATRTSFLTKREHAPEMHRLRTKDIPRSEEHTSELQSRLHLVCRLLLEKKKNIYNADLIDISIH